MGARLLSAGAVFRLVMDIADSFASHGTSDDPNESGQHEYIPRTAWCTAHSNTPLNEDTFRRTL
jgi:hypothetical protein